MTSGSNSGTDGSIGRAARRDPRAITALAFAAFGLLYMVVNAASMIDQRQTLGRPIAPWQAWVLEGTSFIAWLTLLPLVLMVASRLSTRPIWQIVAGHVAGCLAASIAHTALMLMLRSAAFGLAGLDYDPSKPWADRLLFELRKDVITYLSIIAVFLIARRLVAASDTAPPAHTEPTLLELRDGSRTVMLRPDEIDWVSAAGNYVEVHGGFGTMLTRRTMAELENELGPHGFVRVHRSRMVRRATIVSTETSQSGDFAMTLRSGVVVQGSRRFRQNLKGS